MAIVLKNISKSFGTQPVVSRVSLEVENGELFVLLGSSGSGKSTILRLIAGLLFPDSGSIELHGRDVTQLAPQKRNTGVVFQNYAIFRHMTVSENIEFGLKVRRVSRAARKRRSQELLDLVGMSDFGNRLSSQLSGGQRQRVALARALAYEPSVLLLDEPFGALDVQIRSQLRRSLKDIQRQLKVTTILVTHDQEEAFELADRIGVIQKGKLIEVGNSEELYHHPKTEYAATFIGGGNVMVGRSEQGLIRLGRNTFPYPENTLKQEEGAPVRILFRPESVHVQDEAFTEEGPLMGIGQGVLKEQTFAGSSIRMRFELETLEGARPLAPSLSYGQRYAVVEASAPALSNHTKLQTVIGQKYWLGIPSLHVLQPGGLKLLVCVDPTDSECSALKLSARIEAASHGPITALMVQENPARAEESRQILKALCQDNLKGSEIYLETKLREGIPRFEILREAQENFYDLAILGLGSYGTERRLASVARRLLSMASIPVLIASKFPSDIKRILICTSADEYGEGHVNLAARLARHTRASATVLHVLEEKADSFENERVSRHLERAHRTLKAHGVSCDTLTTQGPRLESVLAKAEDGSYDLLIIGAPGPESGFKARPPDFATQIVRAAKQPVLIVPG